MLLALLGLRFKVMGHDPEQLETLHTVAAELRVSLETARQLAVMGRLPFVEVGTGDKRKLRRVRRADLDAFKRATRQEKADQQLRAAKAMASSSLRGVSYY